MALQGTIDDFPITDVLSLLASSSRSGRLALEGDRGRATLLISEGKVVGGGPGADQTDAPRLVFELLRNREGSFGFEATAPLADAPLEVEVPAVPVAECVESADELLQRWLEIESVVPSPGLRARLASDIEADSVELNAEEWRVVAMIGGGVIVDDLRQHLGSDEFSTCERVASLVRAGLVELEESPVVAAAPATEASAIARPVSESLDSTGLAPDQLEGPGAPGGLAESLGLAEPLGLGDTAEAAEVFDVVDPSEGRRPLPPVEVSDEDWDAPAASGVGVDLGSARDEPAVGWLLADDGAMPPRSDHGGVADLGAADDSSTPDRFPIDDLLGDPLGGYPAEERSVSSDEIWAASEAQPPAHPFSQQDSGGAQASSFEDTPVGNHRGDAFGDPADDVLRQMSNLSPEAAEAIATALNSPPAPADEPQEHEGPITYLGTL